MEDMERCFYGGCGEPAEFLDPMDNPFCEDCKNQAVWGEDDVEVEDFRPIGGEK